MRHLLFLFLSLTLSADQHLLDIYQKQGSFALEKIFDEELSTQQYWRNKLKDANTSFGYFETINYLLACNKNDASLKLYAKDINDSFKLSEDFSAFIGKKEGDKQREGDLKTPIGVYKILQKLDHVDKFYGPLAFVTSYPNVYDKVQGKNGSGIWVHGLPLDQERDDYTKGCIAINNTNLQNIEQKIDFHKALVYIDQGEFSKISKETIVILLSNLYGWRKSWKENDIEQYLSYYNETFKRTDGLNLKRFKRYKKRIFKKQEQKQILFTDINIIPYPLNNQKNVFLISFLEKYSSKSFQFDGEKELYVHLDNGIFSILAEK